jgi:heptosyltransferase I
MNVLFESAPKSICILRLSAIGDVCHILPTLRILQRCWPETKITWIIGKTEFNLVKNIPGVNFVIFDKSKGLKSYIRLYKALPKERFDVLLHMQVSLRASIATLLIKAPLRLGFDRKRAKNLQWLFTNAKIPFIDQQHVLDSFLEFPKALGLPCDKVAWNLPVSQTATDNIAKIIPKEGRIMVINPCSSIRIRNYRNWDAASYSEVIDYASEKLNMAIVLTGGPSQMELDYATQIEKTARSTVTNMVGKTDLQELLAILQRATVVIAPDTGPAHLANAVGTPVIGLYATSNPLRTGPYNHQELTVNKYPEAVKDEFKKEVSEVPWGQRVRNPTAMNLITVENVIKKLQAIIN